MQEGGFMKCPYCGNEMKKGYFYSVKGFKFNWFLDNGKRPGIKKNIVYSIIDLGGDLEVGKNVTGGVIMYTHYCKNCGKMVMDLNENEYFDKTEDN